MNRRIRRLIPFLFAGLLAVAVPCAMAVAQSNTSDTDLRAQITNNALNKSQLKDVHAKVEDGNVTLTGTVKLAANKRHAVERVRHVDGVKGIDDEIKVAGPEISDAQLQQKLVKAVEYDRLGYGTTAFNAISVAVNNGVVTLGGTAYGPVDASSAVSTALNMKGVKDVIDNIDVDPVSPMDDRIRIAEYRTIYGFPSLNKYAIDPAKPIRISVQNGHVTLYGQVDSVADKNTAGIRAKTVPGVFSVTNKLNVAGQHKEMNQGK